MVAALVATDPTDLNHRLRVAEAEVPPLPSWQLAPGSKRILSGISQQPGGSYLRIESLAAAEELSCCIEQNHQFWCMREALRVKGDVAIVTLHGTQLQQRTISPIPRSGASPGRAVVGTGHGDKPRPLAARPGMHRGGSRIACLGLWPFPRRARDRPSSDGEASAG